jgi:hypothetical protein
MRFFFKLFGNIFRMMRKERIIIEKKLVQKGFKKKLYKKASKRIKKYSKKT